MPQFDYEKVKDPMFFKENTLEAHSDHICYRSLEELEEKITKTTGFHVMDHEVKLYGYCSECGGKTD